MNRTGKRLSALALSLTGAAAAVVAASPPAAADGAGHACYGFQSPNVSCSIYWADDGSGSAYVTNNPYNDWVFVLRCAWGGDQMSGANPPSSHFSWLNCNLGSPATGGYAQAT